jgi:RNA polymerase sigma-70 factor (ECF subfamily)
MHTTSISLLERLRSSANSEAWGQFVDLYTPLLYEWARKRGLHEADAADLVQDVFLALLQKLPTFAYNPHKSFRGWLFTVTLNIWRDRQRAVATRWLGVGERRVEDVSVPDPAIGFQEQEYRNYLVSRALKLMQADFATVTWQAVWQHAVQGRPAAEVAKELGLSVAAVYCAKFRVLSRLRQELQGLFE